MKGKSRKLSKLILSLSIGIGFVANAYAQTIKIGVNEPLTGPFAASGTYVANGAKIAADEINARGGILGKQLELVVEDNKSNPTEAAAVTERLITGNKVTALMGAWGSTLTLAAMPKLLEYKVPMLVETSSSGKITTLGNPYVFRISPPSSLEAKGFAPLVAKLGIKKVDYLVLNNDWGRGVISDFGEMFKKAGVATGRTALEIWQGAQTLGMPLHDYLAELKEAGLGSLPGTAAEILDDEVRRTLCPDKLTVGQWVDVMRTAHGVGLKSTATIMYGHIERPEHWARHLLVLRDLQEETGGFTEFVPLPFVHMEAPIYRRGGARSGPTFREAVLMHAVARLVLHPFIENIQASWVKMGRDGIRACLQAGVNDLGGTLMNESISRAAGATHGQEMTPRELEAMIRAAGRPPAQRTTLYELAEPRSYVPASISCDAVDCA